MLLVGAVLLFSCIDASAKWLNRMEPSLQTVAVRYIGSFLLVGMFLNPRTKPGVVRTRRPWLQVARAACLVVSTVCAFTSLRYLRITELTSISFSSPLLVAVLAGPMLGERIGPRRVVAVIVGFIGVLIVTRPGTESMHPAVFLALLAAVANAFYSISTRLLAAHDGPETTMLYTGLVGTVLTLPLVPFIWETPKEPLVWVVMVLLSVFAAAGHWLLILAHRRAPASALAPFYYVQLLGAALVGAVVFGEIPDRWTIVGGAVVMSSGLYLVYRERVRHKPVPSSDVAA